jgi:hypothetical protein
MSRIAGSYGYIAPGNKLIFLLFLFLQQLDCSSVEEQQSQLMSQLSSSLVMLLLSENL